MTRNMLLVYVTVRDRRQARRLGARLVEERLAACVNVLGPITSIYRWKGRVQEDGEVALLAKTTEARWPALLRRVRELHPSATPRVVRIPLTQPRTLQLRPVTSARYTSTGLEISMPRPWVPSGSSIVAPWQSSSTFEVEIVTPPV